MSSLRLPLITILLLSLLSSQICQQYNPDHDDIDDNDCGMDIYNTVQDLQKIVKDVKMGKWKETLPLLNGIKDKFLNDKCYFLQSWANAVQLWKLPKEERRNCYNLYAQAMKAKAGFLIAIAKSDLPNFGLYSDMIMWAYHQIGVKCNPNKKSFK